MEFKKTSWFYRVWCWSKKDKPDGVNLCPFMRTVFIWAPLKFIFGRGTITIKNRKIYVPIIVWAYLLFEFPRWMGIANYQWKITIYMIYMVIASLGLIFLSLFFIGWIFSSEGLGFGETLLVGIDTRIAEPVAKSQTVKLIFTYFKAIHDKVCPYIKFK